MISNAEALQNIKETVTLLMGDRSLADIAKLCCTDDWKCYPGHIEKIKNGKNVPNAAMLARVAEALGTTCDAIIHGHHLKTKVIRVAPIAPPAKSRKKAAAK